MVAIEHRQRKGPILTPSSLPCLGNMPTINITEGCAHGCLYCYAQGYASYPGPGRVVVFDNIPALVRAELPRKRRRPQRVYFSPSSDAFQPLPAVRNVTHETMSILLEAGVEVAFLTKGEIDERFLALFAKHSGRVFAQVGITTLDEGLWRAIEPGAAAPAQRLRTIDSLAGLGITVKARLDPLIPDVTDTDESLSPLLAELPRRSVRHIAASYLFLRPPFTRRLAAVLGSPTTPTPPAGAWSWRRLAEGIGGGQMLGPQERRRRFDRLAAVATGHGIQLHVCTCKNPDLAAGQGCQIAGPAAEPLPARDLPLFGAMPSSTGG